MISTAEMARLLHPNYCHERCLAVLKFFGDETGISQNERICAVAGLVGTEKAWGKFDRNWMKVLKAQGITYFHAVDCERGKEDFYGLDVMKRGQIVSNLLNVIMESQVSPYAYGLVKPHFMEWALAEREHFTMGHPDNPYYLVLCSIYTYVASFADRYPSTEQIHFVFEQQDEFEPHARVLFNEFKDNPLWPRSPRLGKLCFEKEKDKYPGIQAADLLAYEMYRHLDNKHFRPLVRDEWKVRSVVQMLYRKLDNGNHARYFDAPSLKLLSKTHYDGLLG